MSKMDKIHSGLTFVEVEESRKKNGENVLTPPKRESLLKLYLEKFNDPIIRVLIVAAILSLGISVMHNEYIETIGIFVAIFLATTVGFWFEYDAQRKFDVLNTISGEVAVRVVRDGKVCEVQKSEIVVGDIVLLENGEEIPADGVLLEALTMRVNESTLTGEPSTSKRVEVVPGKTETAYPVNRVLRGTTVIEGNGVMEVDCVGDATEFGKVATASTEKSGEATPLTKQLERLASIIGVIGFFLALTIFFVLFVKDLFFSPANYSLVQVTTISTVLVALLVGLSKGWMPFVEELCGLLLKRKVKLKTASWGVSAGMGILLFAAVLGGLHFSGVAPFAPSSWIDMEGVGRLLNAFMIAVTLIVVAVPEGLPMSVTLCLALNMRRMLKSNNLVRKMHASETMGAINIICTDKTGTLTKNQMSVREIDFELNALAIESIAVNSTAFLNLQEETAKGIGNPTEVALLLHLHEQGKDYLSVRETVGLEDRVPFSTENKYMATLVNSKALPGSRIIYLKGAPEVILGFSGGVDAPAVIAKLSGYQNRAMRTLALAYKEVPEGKSIKESIAEGGFGWIGVVAISDPVREDVPNAVKECRLAGIDVKIVTGDTSATAKQIAREIGLWNDAEDRDENHMTGVEFEAMSDEVLLTRVQGLKIMSRARPSDKQRLVRLLQKTGGVVAVTGDGTNDAPALNFANVGLSMGSGTSVAKEASDITLVDDSFSSIVSAVMWGRSLYKNIQRFLVFQLTINVVAVAIVFVGAFIAEQPPLTITQMLWVNIIMDTFAAAALASLPPSKRVMQEKPRGVNDFIITAAMRRFILGIGGVLVVALTSIWWVVENEMWFSLEYGYSLFFALFVLLQFWNLFNAKSFDSHGESAFKGLLKSKAFVSVALIILVGQVAITSLGGAMFRSVPLDFSTWAVLIAASGGVLLVGEVARAIKKD